MNHVRGDDHGELVNLYDADGRVIGAAPRRRAKASGIAVGAVNVLAVDAARRVLLQRRPIDKENGGRWDKSVGGHVSAGEDFDGAAVREAGEELFDAPSTPRVRLLPSREALLEFAATAAPRHSVAFYRASLQLCLRDVRVAPEGGGVRNVTYHVAVYLGRCDVPIDRFHPQRSEIDELRYATVAEIDTMLLRGELAPNMAFLWLSHAARLLSLI